MKDSARYVKRVEWSDEDRCFVGSCPGVIGPCCHGDDEVAVYRELCGSWTSGWRSFAMRKGRCPNGRRTGATRPPSDAVATPCGR